ncbi:F-box domain-containing protein [Mycena sanguinolenta]|uniref:F-box domain-containing protein n=1 Tax=Mycena sanguinolenta TaxID=230812 RepID=A0A8H7D431_9AGAR|nr:F-box domain-containing protein [Mycena sanguinolenta]
MSVDKLPARIAKLDTEINLQTEILKRVEHDESLAEPQLNEIHGLKEPPEDLKLERDSSLFQCILDPITRLPLEISSEIFLQSLPPFPEGMYESCPHHIPRLLLSICNAWTNIALSTPGLWSAIHILLPCSKGLKEILPIWLERARNQPLSISLQVEGWFDADVLDIIWQRGPQLKYLQLYEMHRMENNDILKVACPGPLPSLETLVTRSQLGWHLNPPQILYLLRQTPNLVEYFINTRIGRLENTGDDMVHPKLRRLTFGEHGICPDRGTRLLRRLSLPSLEVLSIATSSDVLLSFLRRSVPPLLELTLRTRRDAMDFVALAECAPDLSRLEVWYPEPLAVENLLAALETQSLLPRLDTLVLHLDRHYLPGNGDAFWPALLRALAARRTHVRVFRLTVLGRLPASQLPPPRIRAAIRELGTDGMQVSISATEGRWTSLLGSVDTDTD